MDTSNHQIMTSQPDVPSVCDEIDGDKSVITIEYDDCNTMKEKQEKIQENPSKLKRNDDSDDSAVNVIEEKSVCIDSETLTNKEKDNFLIHSVETDMNPTSSLLLSQINDSLTQPLEHNGTADDCTDATPQPEEGSLSVLCNNSLPTVQTIIVKIEPADDVIPVNQSDPLQYRVKVEPESHFDNDTSSDSSESSSESEVEEEMNQRSRRSSTSSQNDKQSKPCKEDIRTKGELFPEDLPPLEDLTITVDESVNLVHMGSVTSIVGILVIVQSNQNMPPLNEETVLFLEGRVSCGKIFEVFGPVASPWYSLRFNSLEDMSKKGVTIGTKMFCAPKVDEYTNYVFVEHLKQIKGSDASWEDNNEPPAKFVDFSDDEEEKKAKAKQRNKKQDDGDQIPGAKNVKRRKQKQSNDNSIDGQKNVNFQQNIQRHQGPRTFSPFGGQHNKFIQRAAQCHNNQRFPPSTQCHNQRFSQSTQYQNNQRFPPSTQWSSGQNSNSSGYKTSNSGGQSFIRNTSNFVSNNHSQQSASNSHNQQSPNNTFISADFSKPPPPTVNWGNSRIENENRGFLIGSGPGQTSQTEYNQTCFDGWQPPDTRDGQSGWQPAAPAGGQWQVPATAGQSGWQAPAIVGGQSEWQATGRIFGDYNDVNTNSYNNSYNISQQNNQASNRSNTGHFFTNSAPYQSSSPQLVDNRLIQNVEYNQPSQPPFQTNQPLRHRPPFQSMQPRFGGQPQFTRINRPY